MKDWRLTYSPWSCGSRRLLNQALAMLTFVSALLLTACSDDSEQDGKSLVTIEAIPYGQTFMQVEPMSLTRAWVPPTGYYLFDDNEVNGLFVNQTNLISNSMDLFFTQNNGTTPLEAMFVKYGGEWRASLKDEDISAGTPYYLYGFLPYLGSVSASIAPNPSYDQGAVLTLDHLPTVTPNDVCVVVGAKDGTGKETVVGLQEGQFAYQATSDGGDTKNYVFLLFDHLYSAMHFRFHVDGTYAALRTIKLKSLKMLAYDDTSESSALMARTMNATITLKANLTGSSPIENIVFSPDASSTEMDTVLISDNISSPVELPTGVDQYGDDKYADFFGGFVPKQTRRFTVISTYDVYDKHENLIRKDCTATNTIDIQKVYGTGTETLRGRKYIIKMIIKPTYLYMLSEPDLDSPTAVVG